MYKQAEAAMNKAIEQARTDGAGVVHWTIDPHVMFITPGSDGVAGSKQCPILLLIRGDDYFTFHELDEGE